MTTDQQYLLDHPTTLSSLSASQLMNGIQPITLPNQPLLTPVPPPLPVITTAPTDSALTNFLNDSTQNAPPSMEGQYNQDVNNAGISGLQGGVNQANNAVAQEQANLSTINSQLQAISGAGTQAQLNLESGASGKDVTSTFLGRQQQEVARQAGIQALPLQASALASQAKIQGLNGNLAAANTLLQQAQQSVDKLFSIQQSDAQNQFNYKQSLIKAVYDSATTAQKAALDAKATKDAQDFQLQRDELVRQHDVEMEKLNFQNDLALKGMTTGGTGSGNGADVIGSPENIQSLATSQGNINNITDLLKSGGMSTAVGTSILSRSPKGFWGAVGKIATVVGIPGLFKDAWKSVTGQTSNFIAGVEQLQSQLSLDSLIQAKKQGATFGALSDTEMRILSSSASKIGSWVQRDKNGNATGYNTTEKAFKAELDKINNFAKLDYLLKGGNPADVGVVQMEDGAYYSQNSDGTLTKLQ